MREVIPADEFEEWLADNGLTIVSSRQLPDGDVLYTLQDDDGNEVVRQVG